MCSLQLGIAEIVMIIDEMKEIDREKGIVREIVREKEKGKIEMVCHCFCS